MDRESLFKLGLTVCAVVSVSVYIFWGPNIGSKVPRFRNRLLGLQNLGLTCFLNALLQALASCPYFIEWLQTHKGNGKVSDSLLSLLKLLSHEGDGTECTLSPADLISSLISHGWRIAPQEQDTHELFLLLVTTLEEEEHRSTKVGLGVLSESLADLSQLSEQGTVNGVTNSAKEPASGDQLYILKRADVTSPTRSLCDARMLAPPFRGYLASQIQCLVCNFKSPMRYDKFDTLSLTLPSGLGFKQTVTLHTLLEAFVRTEILDDFACEACNKAAAALANSPSKGSGKVTSKALRTVRIGKLPKCLCLHISRTYMNPDGFPYKRDNYVDFPEYLAMAPFTQNSYLRELKVCLARKKKLEELAVTLTNRGLSQRSDHLGGGETPSDISGTDGGAVSNIPQINRTLTSTPPPSGFISPPSGLASPPSGLVSPPSGLVSPMTMPTPERIPSPDPHTDTASWVTPTATPPANDTPIHSHYSSFLNGVDSTVVRKQMYRVKAVIEHRGSIENGHFVTYRRGPMESNIRHRSDEEPNRQDRWYFTSDADVRESSMCHAMMSCAYMLFYEKCSVFEERRI